jgi:hypothetical protein
VNSNKDGKKMVQDQIDQIDQYLACGREKYHTTWILQHLPLEIIDRLRWKDGDDNDGDALCNHPVVISAVDLRDRLVQELEAQIKERRYFTEPPDLLVNGSVDFFSWNGSKYGGMFSRYEHWLNHKGRFGSSDRRVFIESLEFSNDRFNWVD